MDFFSCLSAGGYGRVIGVLAALFLFGCLYAIALEVLERRWGFVGDYTWLTVVAGVGFTLAGLAVLAWPAALLALLTFAASSIPVIVRSIILDVRRRLALRDTFLRRGGE